MHRGIIVKSTFFSCIAFILVMTSFCDQPGDNKQELHEETEQLQEEKGDLEKRLNALISLLLCIAVTVIPFLGKCIRDLEKRMSKMEKTINEKKELEWRTARNNSEEPQEKMEEPQEKMEELQEKMEEPQEKMEEPQEKMEEPQEKMGQLENKIKELQEKMGLLENKIKELQEKMDEMKKELEWRRVQNNSDDITLNGITAHPNLHISGDKKSFTHEAQPQKVSSNPERFDSTICVLGSEAFSSGKHYWEVDVRSSTDWDLGVARKSIGRKGKLSLSPREGFWALGFSGRDYWAKTNPWTRVTVQNKPKKIGVYLSYQEGQVTFLNVTDMSVLFTFNDCSFSGEVYPFFKNSHKETTMRICSS